MPAPTEERNGNEVVIRYHVRQGHDDDTYFQWAMGVLLWLYHRAKINTGINMHVTGKTTRVCTFNCGPDTIHTTHAIHISNTKTKTASWVQNWGKSLHNDLIVDVQSLNICCQKRVKVCPLITTRSREERMDKRQHPSWPLAVVLPNWTGWLFGFCLQRARQSYENLMDRSVFKDVGELVAGLVRAALHTVRLQC
jgi:hypothetical protein